MNDTARPWTYLAIDRGEGKAFVKASLSDADMWAQRSRPGLIIDLPDLVVRYMFGNSDEVLQVFIHERLIERSL